MYTTALLSRETTALQEGYQQNDRILEFYSPVYLYFQMKTILKMVEASSKEFLPEVPYDLPKLDTKRQELIDS